MRYSVFKEHKPNRRATARACARLPRKSDRSSIGTPRNRKQVKKGVNSFYFLEMFSIKYPEIGVFLYAPQIDFEGKALSRGGQGLTGQISPLSGHGERLFVVNSYPQGCGFHKRTSRRRNPC